MTQKKKENVTTAVAEEFVTSHLPTELYKEFEEMMQKVRMHSLTEKNPAFVIDAEVNLRSIRELMSSGKDRVIDEEEFDKVRERKLDIEHYAYYLQKLKEFLSQYNLKELCTVRADDRDSSRLLVQMKNPYQKDVAQAFFHAYEDEIQNVQKLPNEVVLSDIISLWVEEQETSITWTDEEITLCNNHLKEWLSIMNKELDRRQSMLLDFSVLKDAYTKFSLKVIIDFLEKSMEDDLNNTYIKEICKTSNVLKLGIE